MFVIAHVSLDLRHYAKPRFAKSVIRYLHPIIGLICLLSIRTSYLGKVRPFVGLDIIKVITGMSRSWKFVLMEQIKEMRKSWCVPIKN